jgi:choline dehydrogenase-like flavoprotein
MAGPGFSEEKIPNGMGDNPVNVNNRAVKENTFDAIVVGSGISGGWAAKELTEKGLHVLMLERGRNFEHIRDYHSASKNPWELRNRGKSDTEQLKAHPQIAKIWGDYEPIMDYWTNDLENPYTQIRPFNWVRAYQLGGRSILWGRQCYRWSDLDFEANFAVRELKKGNI